MSDTPPANSMTWEEAVAWLRAQPGSEALVRACFFDDPLFDAAKRFHECTEWRAVRDLLPRPTPGARALDVGAGRGIASYALAADGWQVTALEPDPSGLVGAGAIAALAHESGLPIVIEQQMGERMPFDDASFDVVHARQVLHHARDLEQFCAELFRVLKPGGTFIATREHVVDNEADLAIFLEAHSLHRLYGGEHAFTLPRYLQALRTAGFALTHVLSPWESDINIYPSTVEDIRRQWARRWHLPSHRLVPMALVRRRSRALTEPGRLYTFVGRRP
ncbi:class I SAM-dependent methyltransferase [Megalodesulfovibrio paquesii]